MERKRRFKMFKSAGSVAQVMPQRSVRLDPSVSTDFAVWLICQCRKWDKVSKLTTSGLIGEELIQRSHTIRWAKHAVAAVYDLLSRLTDLVPIDDWEAAKDEVIGAIMLAQTCKGSPPLPGTDAHFLRPLV